MVAEELSFETDLNPVALGPVWHLDIGVGLRSAIGINGSGCIGTQHTRLVSAGYSHTGTDRASKLPRPQREKGMKRRGRAGLLRLL